LRPFCQAEFWSGMDSTFDPIINWTLIGPRFLEVKFVVIEKAGGDDETRTRDLCRARAASQRNSLISNGIGGQRMTP
jgi:hypothetical protein